MLVPRTSKFSFETLIPDSTTFTFKSPLPKSIAPPVKLPTITVTVFAEVTVAVIVKSVTSSVWVAITKSPNAAPVTVTSTACSLPSAIEPKSTVVDPSK